MEERVVTLSPAAAIKLAQYWARRQGARQAVAATVAAAEAADADYQAALEQTCDALDVDHAALDVEVKIDKGLLLAKPKVTAAAEAQKE